MANSRFMDVLHYQHYNVVPSAAIHCNIDSYSMASTKPYTLVT